MLLKILVIFNLFIAGLVVCESNADILNKDVQRAVDLTSHLVKITNVITVENQGSQPLTSYTFVIEAAQAENVAFIGAQTHGENGDELKVTQNQGASAKGTFYKVDFLKPVAPGKTLQFDVEVAFIRSLRLLPSEITQYEKQYVLYTGNAYFYSLYTTNKQVTKVSLSSDKVESYSQLKPTSKSDSTITYGPYADVKPFEQSEIQVHYENNSPFLTVANIVRTIEVSHWGNIAVEETIDLYHSGALLKGPFHRIDYMRKIGGASSVKSWKTNLPRVAKDVYYRDEIGNISTSNLRYKSDLAELEVRPRFPLFGGWRTHYTVGYNLPTFQYLYTKGNNFLLKMNLVDHIYDEQFIEKLTVRIILPEHSQNIQFTAPFDVKRGANELHYTYLDVVGRPVVVIEKANALDYHAQNFELRYTFDKTQLFQEPLLLVGVFFLIFLLVIFLVRIDFSISQDSVKEQKAAQPVADAVSKKNH